MNPLETSLARLRPPAQEEPGLSRDWFQRAIARYHAEEDQGAVERRLLQRECIRLRGVIREIADQLFSKPGHDADTRARFLALRFPPEA